MGLGVAFALLVFLLGASVGSFLNVVIYRVPHGKSVINPPSSCPSCGARIKAWQNIPVFSWLLLRGRCGGCKGSISIRYPLVELVMGIIALALFHDFSGGWLSPERLGEIDPFSELFGPFALYLAFLASLVAITFIDLDHFIIPDSITLPGVVLGVVASFACGTSIGITWIDGLIGAVAGAGLLIGVIVLYATLTGREGMGGGDWKLLGFIGAWLGWQGLPFVLLAGSIQGLLFALIFRQAFAVDELPPDPMEEGGVPEPVNPQDETTSFRHLAVPFGPFLSLAAIELLLFRDEIRTFLSQFLGGVLP